MPTVLITGCDTGVGREFARQYALAGWTVLATYLDPSNRLELEGTGDRITHHRLDVTEPDQFSALRQTVGAVPIDVLLSNAGIGLEKAQFGNVDYEYALRMYRTNTLGPLRLAETFVDNVAASALRRMVAISSRMGSIAGNLTGAHYGYRASKAGLNAIMRSLAVDLTSRNISVVVLHPGAVAVPSAPNGPVAVEVAVEGMRRIIERLGPHGTGQFYHFDGTPLPW